MFLETGGGLARVILREFVEEFRKSDVFFIRRRYFIDAGFYSFTVIRLIAIKKYIKGWKRYCFK